MTIIFLLIAVSLLVAVGFLVMFIWAVKSGQFDDDYTPSVRMLFEEKKKVTEKECENPQKKDNNFINNSNTNKN